MGLVLLVRDGLVAGDHDALSPLGWEQARTLGEALAARGVRPDVLLCGDQRRHRETLDGVCGAAGWLSEVVVDPGWNDFDHARMLSRYAAPLGEGFPTPMELQEWFEEAALRWGSGDHDHEYDESFTAFGSRVGAALDRAVARATGPRTVVVFTSGGPIAWAAASLICGQEAPATVWNRINSVVVNASVTKVGVAMRGTTLVALNDHSHLEGTLSVR